MKFDKETMLKQHFWLLLALAVPLTLGAYFFLMTTVRGAIAADRKKLESDWNSANSPGDIKNEKWVKMMEDKAAEMAKKEEEVWKEAYDKQKDISTWPEVIEKEFNFKDGYFATEIKVERSKDKEKATGKFPENDASHFHGLVKDYRSDYVTVVGEKPMVGTKDKEIRFQATAKIKVSGDKIADIRDLNDGDRVAVTFIRSKYFFDPLTESEQKAFIKDEAYKSQIPEIIEQVNPVNANGEGVVQLHNWTYKKGSLPPANAQFFRYVAQEWDANHDKSDEIWMAQEDLWVQREIYRIIREANDSVSIFKGEGGDAKPNTPQTYTFTNPYWELTLTLAGKKKLGVTIKNRLPWRQRLDLDFRIKLQKDTSRFETITVGGEPLGPGKSSEPKEYDVQGQAATGIYGVEQVINWETAAVKRIDHISFGSLAAGDCAHGHRTFPEGLKPFREKKEGAAQQGQGPGGLDPKMKMIDKGMMDKGKGKGDAAANLGPNGLRIDRYIEKPSRQTRRIPIGVALIVDQEHVDRVLLAFSKSRLRFLTTQVILNRYPHSVRPETGNFQADKKGFNPNDFGGKEMKIGPGPGGFRNQPQASSSAGSEQESNMELVVYGIVTMYERYPPRPKTP